MLNLNTHHKQVAQMSSQLAATDSLKGKLWKQTIKAKIRNQAALLKAHHELDKHLIVGQMDDTQLTTQGQMPKLLRQWAVDGLLVFYTTQFPEQMIDMINNDRIPAVWMNADLTENAVRPDDFDAGFQATQKLIAMGHRESPKIQVTNQDACSYQDDQ